MEVSHAEGVLPPPRIGQAAEVERRNMRTDLLMPFQGLTSIGRDDLKSLVDVQRKQFAKGGKKDADPGMDAFTPRKTPLGEHLLPPNQPERRRRVSTYRWSFDGPATSWRTWRVSSRQA